MFTGIVQEVGKIASIAKRARLMRLGIRCVKVYDEAAVSDSICVDGTCLTVTDKKKGILYFDVVKETYSVTTLQYMRIGTEVNLESSLKVGDKLGGHFVLGHVDCATYIKRIKRLPAAATLEISYPLRLKKCIVEKGSIAVDGISLTIQKLYSSSFVVSIIPYTFQHTSLRNKRATHKVNIEFDYLLKNRGIAQFG